MALSAGPFIMSGLAVALGGCFLRPYRTTAEQWVGTSDTVVALSRAGDECARVERRRLDHPESFREAHEAVDFDAREGTGGMVAGGVIGALGLIGIGLGAGVASSSDEWSQLLGSLLFLEGVGGLVVGGLIAGVSYGWHDITEPVPMSECAVLGPVLDAPPARPRMPERVPSRDELRWR